MSKNTTKMVGNTIKLFAIAFLLTSGFTSSVSAWGPERTTYTNDAPASYATFNSITDNAAVGDERNFVRVGEVGSTSAYVDEIEVVPGKEYEVYIYYHNNAASNTNQSGYGMATNTRMSSAYPVTLNSNERGMVSGIISWSYVNPSNDQTETGKVWDEAYLTTKTDGVVLKFKASSAIIHNAGEANGSILPTALFSETGTPIGFNKLAGTIPGCAEYSGYVTYTLVAEKPGTPAEDCSTNPQLPGCQEVDCTTNPEAPECQEKNCATNPEMEGCQELPNTGPVEIILAIVIIAGIIGGGYYFYRTKKTLKSVEKDAKGDATEQPKEVVEKEAKTTKAEQAESKKAVKASDEKAKK